MRVGGDDTGIASRGIDFGPAGLQIVTRLDAIARSCDGGPFQLHITISVGADGSNAKRQRLDLKLNCAFTGSFNPEPIVDI